MDDGPSTVVIDNGSGFIKCGLSGNQAPTATFASVVGYPKNKPRHSLTQSECFVGEEAQLKRGMLILKYPIQHGLVQDWDDMERIWNHAFENELQVIEDKVPSTLLTETPMNSDMERSCVRPMNSYYDVGNTRERTTQVMFETIQVPRLFLANDAVLSLYASGRTTGLSVGSGHGVTSVVPIFSGFSLRHATHRWQFGGDTLMDHDAMQSLAHSQGAHINLNYAAQRELIPKAIKERCCYVSMNFHEEMANFTSKQFVMPDLEHVIEAPNRTWDPTVCKLTLGAQLIQIPEYIFSGVSSHSKLDRVICLPELVMQAVRDSDADLRSELLSHVVLSGGNTAFRNFEPRFYNEVQHLVNEKLAPSWHRGRKRMDNVDMPDCSVHTCSLRRVRHSGQPGLLNARALGVFGMARFCPSSAAHVLGRRMVQTIGEQLPPDMYASQCSCSAWVACSSLYQHSVGPLKPLADSESAPSLAEMAAPAAWIGGSVLSSLSTFSKMWMNSESDLAMNGDATTIIQSPVSISYDDVGPRMVHQMCNL